MEAQDVVADDAAPRPGVARRDAELGRVVRVRVVPGLVGLVLLLQPPPGEVLRFKGREAPKHKFEARQVDRFFTGHEAAQRRAQLLVRRHHQVQGPVRDLQVRHVRQEVVADQHAQAHEVVDEPLDVPVLVELQSQHVPQQAHLEQFEVVPRVLQRILGLPPPPRVPHGHLLPQQEKFRFVRHEPEHDQVRVQAVETVLRRAPRFRLLPRPNKVHDLVLALARDVGARKHDFHRLVERVVGALVREPRLEGLAELGHERRAGRDAVRVESVGVGRHVAAGRDEFRAQLLALLRRAEPAAPLLVHLRARRDAVDGEDDRALGGDDLADLVREGEDAHELVARAGLRDLGVVAVRAHVDDAVHVEVQVVDVRLFLLRRQAVGHALHDRRVLVREPTKHLRDAARDDGGAGRLSHTHRLEPSDGPGRERQQQ